MEERPPSPGDDATPFLLRVFVKPVPFRSLQDFHSEARLSRDEFKLHVWKTNTLREVAQMLYDADTCISTPLALHAFRRIHRSERLPGDFEATPIGVGITRVPLASVSALLSDLDIPDEDRMDTDTPEQRQNKAHDRVSTSKLLGWDLLEDEIDENAAAITLAELNLVDRDMVDCVIKPDPSLALAPKPSRPMGRDRQPPPERFSHSPR
ncbi:uncharacterized protein UDID_01975 [Ustilago sp. UG-2017a]|nr:uncharacterized protein UDID_01975 [Ustilago sp. UG-2017a]